MNFKEWIIKEELEDDSEKAFSQKHQTQKANVAKLLGFKKPLVKVNEGSFATLYQHPENSNILIKITSHKEDVQNIIRAQKIKSSNVVKIYPWPDKTSFKTVATKPNESLAILVEKIIGKPMDYSTNHFYMLALGGQFQKAKDWLNSGGNKKQQDILNLYKKNTDEEHNKLAEMFESLFQLERFHGISLTDYQDNILDTGDRYVIVDMGY